MIFGFYITFSRFNAPEFSVDDYFFALTKTVYRMPPLVLTITDYHKGSAPCKKKKKMPIIQQAIT